MSHRHLLHCLVEVELIHMFLVSGFQSHMLLQTTLLTLSGTTFWKLNKCDQNNIFKLSQHLHIFITWVTIDEADTTYVSGSTTGCPVKLSTLWFCYFLGFQSTYRRTSGHFSIAQEMRISKLTLLYFLCEKLIKLQHKMWDNLDFESIILMADFASL